jgi:hypothetical protein
MTTLSTLTSGTSFSRTEFRREQWLLSMFKLQTDQQVADILTKPLAKGKFKMFRERLGLMENAFLGKRKC